MLFAIAGGHDGPGSPARRATARRAGGRRRMAPRSRMQPSNSGPAPGACSPSARGRMGSPSPSAESSRHSPRSPRGQSAIRLPRSRWAGRTRSRYGSRESSRGSRTSSSRRCPGTNVARTSPLRAASGRLRPCVTPSSLLNADTGPSGAAREETAILSKVSSPDSWGPTRWGVSGQARAQTSQFIRDSGYAIRRKPGRSVGLIATTGGGPWWYPKLHTWNADHFARPEFGQLNALYTISSGPTGWTIGFCTKRPRTPGHCGHAAHRQHLCLHAGGMAVPDPKPKEDAGGEIVFLTGTTSALLPLVSYFWKLAGGSEGEDPLYTANRSWRTSGPSTSTIPSAPVPRRDGRAEDDPPQPLARSNSFMNSTSASTPAARQAL